MVQQPSDRVGPASGVAAAGETGPAGGRDESALERWDRNFGELLQELRVVQTGPQILLAFLLTVPFTNRFGQTDSVEKSVYAVTLLAAAAAATLLITPAAYHRLVFRQGRKAELVRVANLLIELGLGCLALAIVGTVFVALNVALNRIAAIAAGGAVALLAVLLWYALPTINKLRLYRRVGAAPGEPHGVTAEQPDRPETR